MLLFFSLFGNIPDTEIARALVLSLPSNDSWKKGQDGHQAEQKAKRCSFFIKKAMTEPKPIFKDTEKLIIASSKPELVALAIAILGQSNEKIKLIDPEKPADHVPYFQEPAGDNPFTAVKFKLHRLIELFKDQTDEDHDLVFYASDVVFSANGETYHKPKRDNELTLEELIPDLIERYQQPFTADWHVAFGAATEKSVSMGSIRVQAEYPGLTAEEISANLNLDANTGLDLVEIGIAKKLSFKLYLENNSEPIVLNDEVGYKLVEQLIIQKLPTKEMFANLIEREVNAHPDRYGLLVQSFIILERYSIDWQLGMLFGISPPSGPGVDLAFMSQSD